MPARLIPAVVAMSLALCSCASFDAAKFRTVKVLVPAEPATWRDLPIVSGQIVVSEHVNAGSLFLSLVAERFEPFIHAGLIVFDDGIPYVYEAFGTMHPGRGPPSVGMRGGVRRVTLEAFLARDRIMAIYEPPAHVERRRLVDFARARWREHTPFDGVFDLRDSSRLYCVEFVARALEAAGAAPFAPVPVNRNASVSVVFEWLQIETDGLLLAGTLIDGQRRVALISRRLTEPQISQYFARKAELHRRFSADQRLGNVLYWRMQSLHYRPAVAAYLSTGVEPGADPRELAARMLGGRDGASAETAALSSAAR